MPAIHPAPFVRLAAVAVIATSCATVPPAPAASGSRAPLTSPLVLTAAEISGARVSSAYEAVERLKPNFLIRARGQPDLAERAVYLNGIKLLGGIENLRTIEASTVFQIEFLNRLDAVVRYGTGSSAGAILVTTLPPGWSILKVRGR